MNTVDDLFAMRDKKKGLIEVNLIYGDDRKHYTCEIGIKRLLRNRDQTEVFTTFVVLPQVKEHREALSKAHEFVRKMRRATDVELLAIWLAYLGKKDTVDKVMACMKKCIEAEE